MDGTVDFSSPGTAPFVLEGVASHLGSFTAEGQADFAPGEEPGTTRGVGIVVFKAANGDLLVGEITFDVDGPDVGAIHTSWRDAVQFSDGTIVATTGRFVKNRPPGAVFKFELIFVATILVLGLL